MSNLILGKFALENLYYSTLAIRHVVLSFIEGMDSRHFHRKNVGDHSPIRRGNLSSVCGLKNGMLGTALSNRSDIMSFHFQQWQGAGFTDTSLRQVATSARRLYNAASIRQTRHRHRWPRRQWRSGCSGRKPSRANVYSSGA